MNEQWMEEIKHNDAVIFLEKYFPGKSFGDKTEQIAKLCRIAEKSGFTDSESIRKIISVQVGGDAIPLHDETLAPDGRRIIGKNISAILIQKAVHVRNVLNMPVGFSNGRKKKTKCLFCLVIRIASAIMKMCMKKIQRKQFQREKNLKI